MEQSEQSRRLKIDYLDDSEQYRRLHSSVFNTPIIDVPPVVIVGRRSDGTVVGFVSGFWLGDNHFYIQYSGILPEFQNSGYSRQLIQILDDNVTYDIAVRNTNIAALKTSLNVGFVPIGMILQNGECFIQLKRDKHG